MTRLQMSKKFSSGTKNSNPPPKKKPQINKINAT